MGEQGEILAAKAAYGLGLVLAARGQLDSALYYFRVATKASPTLSDAWADLAVLLLQLHRFDDALEAQSRAIELNRDNYLYWFNYGVLLGDMRRYEEAKAAFERCLALHPDFDLARRKLDMATKFLR